MGRFKAKKQDTFIDMTPMSDVMVLLLTFFMLTATFTKEEPVKVVTPGSISEIKIPANNLLTIFVEKSGKVFMVMDSPQTMRLLANQMNEDEKLDLSNEEIEIFAQVPTFGTPLNTMRSWLKSDVKNEILTKNAEAGIPCDSLNDELGYWVSAATTAIGEDHLKIAIKADKSTPYSVIKNVMASLRKVDCNRYNLITSLKGADE